MTLSKEKKGKGQLGQLERAFAALDALVNASQPLKLTALAEVTQLDASGTMRLLKTMTDLGLVIRDEAHKAYLPSVRALFPLGLYHPIQELRRDASDLLNDIQRTTTAISALQIFLGDQRVVIEQRYGSSRLTPFWDTTIKSAYHSSSTGKLYLATLGLQERLTLMGPGPFERFTPNTRVTFEELELDIQTGLARGFFSVLEEAFIGMASVAAPLYAPNGCVIGAMIATGTSGQMPAERIVECGEAVRQAAEMLSKMSPSVRALEGMLGNHVKDKPNGSN